MSNVYAYLERFRDVRFFTKKKAIIHFFLSPWFVLLESVVYRYYWKNLIITELLTSDPIVEFLDKNEFEYKGNKLIKIDLLSSNEFYNRTKLREAEDIIWKDFKDALMNLLPGNVSFNVEDYITLLVTCDTRSIRSGNEIASSKIYTVEIYFCRLPFYKETMKKFKSWVLMVTIMIGILLVAGYIF
jgi:hypothetical protein